MFHPSVTTSKCPEKEIEILFYLTKLKTHWDQDLVHNSEKAAAHVIVDKTDWQQSAEAKTARKSNNSTKKMPELLLQEKHQFKL